MPGFGLAGFLQNPAFTTLEDKLKAQAAARASAVDQQIQTPAKKSSGGISLGGVLSGAKEGLGNVVSGLSKTGQDINDLNPFQQVFNAGRDVVQGDNPLGSFLEPSANILSGRHIAGNFGGSKQFARLPEAAQVVADVAPQAALAAASGGTSEAVPLGGMFLKQLALNAGINYGLQKGSKAAENLPGWRSLSGTNQNALITGATMLGGHVLGKATSREALGNAKELGPTAVKQALANPEQGGYRPFPEEPLDPVAAELAGIKPNTRPSDPKLAEIWDAAHNPSALGPGLSDLPPLTVDSPPSQPAVGSDSFENLAAINSKPRLSDWSDESLIQRIREGTDSTLPRDSQKGLEDQTSLIDAYKEAQRRGLDVPRSLEAPKGFTVNQDGKMFKDGIETTPGLSNESLSGEAYIDSLSYKELQTLVANPEKFGADPTELALAQAKLNPPTIGGGASKWRTLFHEGPVSTINSTIRGAHTLFDLATFGRLGPQVALRNPNEYSQAMKTAISSLKNGREPVKAALAQLDAEAARSGGLLPTTEDMRKNGLSLHTPSTGLLQAVPVVHNVAGMYQNFLDVLRPMMVQEEIRNRLTSGKMIPTDYADLKGNAVAEQPALTPEVLASKSFPAKLPKDYVYANPEELQQVTKGVNLLTGSSSLKMGKEGNLLFEFPNWLAAQGEMITKAMSSGQIDGQMARQSLVRLVGLGTAVTTAANMLQGDSNPLSALTAHTRNGIPQTQIPGTDMQIDMFGPLGELVSKLSGVGKGTVQGGQSGGVEGAVAGASSALGSAYRGFASPVAKIGTDILSQSTATGERVQTPTERILDVIDQALPFSAAEAGHAINFAGDKSGLGTPVPKSVLGTRSAASGVLGNLGLRVHEPSATTRALSDAGISQEDPDYLIKRREYLLQHPELSVTNDVTDTQQRIQKERAQLDTTLRDPNSGMSLVTFRDERTKILQDQRNTLKALLGDKQELPANSKQAGWLQSYNKLFDQAKNPDDPSGQTVSSDKLDPLIADWTNENGQAALDFVNRYTSSGLSQSEQSYIKDLRTLDAVGYFKAKSNLYVNMSSGLTPAEIDRIHFQVEANRLQSPNPPPFAVSLAKLHPELSKAEQADIINSTKKAFQSPELAKLKSTYRKELLWFNPRATWDTYQGAVPGAKVASSGSSSGIPKIPKLGGSLPSIPKIR